MKIQLFLIQFICCVMLQTALGQIQTSTSTADSLPILRAKPKIQHAEPLYIDLIRDLGAHKGEREWNVGLGMTDRNHYDAYTTLVEYEFAIMDRLGLEIELPFTLYYPNQIAILNDSVPHSRLNSLKLAGQYTFLVSEKYQSSLALGYIHEFELSPFVQYRRRNPYIGNIFNPFLVAAKRWGGNFHSLIYAGPMLEQHWGQALHWHWQFNTNLHYLIPGTRNFVGIEFNKEFSAQQFHLIIRPQMRLSLTDQLLVGIVAGVPTKREEERLSMFLRLIYEPKHKKH